MPTSLSSQDLHSSFLKYAALAQERLPQRVGQVLVKLQGKTFIRASVQSEVKLGLGVQRAGLGNGSPAAAAPCKVRSMVNLSSTA